MAPLLLLSCCVFIFMVYLASRRGSVLNRLYRLKVTERYWATWIPSFSFSTQKSRWARLALTRMTTRSKPVSVGLCCPIHGGKLVFIHVRLFFNEIICSGCSRHCGKVSYTARPCFFEHSKQPAHDCGVCTAMSTNSPVPCHSFSLVEERQAASFRPRSSQH